MALILRDRSGHSSFFDFFTGRLVRVSDADGRVQVYEYDGDGFLQRILDAPSGRGLHIGWTGQRVTSISTDPPEAGQPAPTWTYSYTGGWLTSVCGPGAACTEYSYLPSSHYRSVVLDSEPLGYWPLGETEGTTAFNVAANGPGERDATYVSAVQGEPGAIGGSPDPATSFAAGSGSHIRLPQDLTTTSAALSVELWFKAQPGNAGILVGLQDRMIGETPSEFLPMLYVGTDGRIRGQFRTETPAAVSHSSPTSRWTTANGIMWCCPGAWTAQTLVLDGVMVAQTAGDVISHGSLRHANIGTGHADDTWPATPAAGGLFPFTGDIDEVAVYDRWLPHEHAAYHHQAGGASKRLATITEPGGFVATTLAYNGHTGRAQTLHDRHGATWTLSAPSLVPGERRIALHSSDRPEPITYSYDTQHNGRIVSRTERRGDEEHTRTWQYADNGFVRYTTDENGNRTEFVTDERGNVTQKATCRTPGDQQTCAGEYFGYYLNPADPVDPRNDVQIWSSDSRSADANDPSYRTTRTIDAAGRTTKITHPVPAGATTAPQETFEYTSREPYAQTVEARPFIQRTTQSYPCRDTALT